MIHVHVGVLSDPDVRVLTPEISKIPQSDPKDSSFIGWDSTICMGAYCMKPEFVRFNLDIPKQPLFPSLDGAGKQNHSK